MVRNRIHKHEGTDRDHDRSRMVRVPVHNPGSYQDCSRTCAHDQAKALRSLEVTAIPVEALPARPLVPVKLFSNAL